MFGVIGFQSTVTKKHSLICEIREIQDQLKNQVLHCIEIPTEDFFFFIKVFFLLVSKYLVLRGGGS